MSRRKSKAEIRWQDLYQVLVEWQDAQGVAVQIQIRPDVHVRTGGVVEVSLYDPEDVERVCPLVTTVRGFPFLLEGGQAGVLLHTAFEALMAYDSSPWAWTRARRERAVPEPWPAPAGE